MQQITPFHLAIVVRDIDEARDFYGVKLGFAEGRSSDSWIDFNMFGHQLVVHLNPAIGKAGKVANIHNPVDGHGVPVPHFGVVLTFDDWYKLKDKVSGFIDEFVIAPCIRFTGQPGEQGTMFFVDPSGNALEFKAFKDIETQLFAK
jgi:extradiol dioxygenase family protein